MLRTCTHYYVVVARGHRGRGLGKVLVTSAEELCGADVYLATTTEDNVASRRMFRSLCYAEYAWSRLETLYGWDVVDELVRLTCGYEDDVVMVRPAKKLGELAEALKAHGAPDEVWERVCYEPWRRLFTL